MKKLLLIFLLLFSTLSAMTTEFTIAHNPVVTHIVVPDYGYTKITIEDCPKIVLVYIIKAPDLEEISISLDQPYTLNLLEAPKLRRLALYSNNIITLTLPTLPALQYLIIHSLNDYRTFDYIAPNLKSFRFTKPS